MEIVELASKDRWETVSQSTGLKYGGPTDLADKAIKALARFAKAVELGKKK